MSSYRSDVEQLLDQWVDEPGQGKNIVNCLIDWLYADGWWLDKNISQYDRERLKEMAEKL